MRLLKLICLYLVCWSMAHAADIAQERRELLRGCFGSYDGEPRLANKHVDIDKLLSELTEQGANTYNWLIWHQATDWEDLHAFLPRAKKQHINVWVTVCPPTESAPAYHDSEPFKQDYEKWAEEIGKLSAKEKNLVAFSIDDFMANRNVYTPAKIDKMMKLAHASNPKLAFIPCCYYGELTTAFWKDYGKNIDALLFPYFAASSGANNLTNATFVESEVRKMKAIVGDGVPVIVDVYATPHNSYPGGSSLPYCRDVMQRAHRAADGVMIYCHQGRDLTMDKFQMIKGEFQQWKGKAWRSDAEQRKEFLRGGTGTYYLPPRLKDGHVNIPKLLAELEDIHANTYNWLVRSDKDWSDFKVFLPLAREKNLRVWASLVPPSEPPASFPYKLDYKRWAKEFAKLSLKEPNLVAWSIDDFPYNLKVFTPAYVEEMQSIAHKINPKLAFAPCCYFKQMSPHFAQTYGPLCDGILFPYRADSAGGNLKDASLVETEFKTLRERFPPDYPIVLDVYATRHSRLGASTPQYVDELVGRGLKCADGVLIYCHQDPQRDPEKYVAIKEQFGQQNEMKRHPARVIVEGTKFVDRTKSIVGCIGTYGTPPRLPNGRADLPKLLNELVDIHANTFHYAIHQNATDWDDAKLFLPMAREKNINVWITVMPPSESPPRLSKYSEPFRLDYMRWAQEIAKLSLKETNLVAWSIDDFTHNEKILTGKKVAEMTEASHKINPKLAFVPCCYYWAINHSFMKNYGSSIDGILFPYRDESGGGSLKNPDDFDDEMVRLRETVGPHVPIILDVYATAHSRLGATTPEYVHTVVKDGLELADGVLIYKHQDPDKDAEKYAVVKKLFGEHVAKFAERK